VRGSRVKHLRAWYKRTTGKAPGRSTYVREIRNRLTRLVTGYEFIPSQWRRLKKAYRRGLLKSYR
jgi:hypothetical protein